MPTSSSDQQTPGYMLLNIVTLRRMPLWSLNTNSPLSHQDRIFNLSAPEQRLNVDLLTNTVLNSRLIPSFVLYYNVDFSYVEITIDYPLIWVKEHVVTLCYFSQQAVPSSSVGMHRLRLVLTPRFLLSIRWIAVQPS